VSEPADKAESFQSRAAEVNAWRAEETGYRH
jgi:hypothetical protein